MPKIDDRRFRRCWEEAPRRVNCCTGVSTERGLQAGPSVNVTKNAPSYRWGVFRYVADKMPLAEAGVVVIVVYEKFGAIIVARLIPITVLVFIVRVIP